MVGSAGRGGDAGCELSAWFTTFVMSQCCWLRAAELQVVLLQHHGLTASHPRKLF